MVSVNRKLFIGHNIKSPESVITCTDIDKSFKGKGKERRNNNVEAMNMMKEIRAVAIRRLVPYERRGPKG